MSVYSSTIKETTRIIIGELIVLLLMYAIFALADHLDSSVILGGLLGAAANILYFFLMCLGLGSIVSEEDNDKRSKKLKLSYHLRLLVLGILVAIGLKFSCFNNIAVIIPVLMTRPIIVVSELFGHGIKL